MTPKFVQPDEIRHIWYAVAPMVSTVRERINARWITEDVYARCVNGQAGMYVTEGTDGGLTGVVVVEATRDWGEPVLNVWVCYHDGREGGLTIKDYWPWVQDTARHMGCTRVSMSGPRANHKVLPGVTLVHNYFEARV